MSSTERLYLPSDDAAADTSTKTALIIAGTAIGIVFLIALIVMWNRPARHRHASVRYSEQDEREDAGKDTQ